MTEGHLGKGNTLRKREKNGRRKYWHIGHCVDEMLTSHFNTIYCLAIVRRPLLMLSEDNQVVGILPWLRKIQVQTMGKKEVRPRLWEHCET